MENETAEVILCIIISIALKPKQGRQMSRVAASEPKSNASTPSERFIGHLVLLVDLGRVISTHFLGAYMFFVSLVGI